MTVRNHGNPDDPDEPLLGGGSLSDCTRSASDDDGSVDATESLSLRNFVGATADAKGKMITIRREIASRPTEPSLQTAISPMACHKDSMSIEPTRRSLLSQ